MSEENKILMSPMDPPESFPEFPKAAEVETVMLEKEAQKPDDNPLNAHAQLFYMYNPRFQNQLTFLSNKQLIKLAQTLSSSEHNKPGDVAYLATLGGGLNQKGLLRVIGYVIEHPLNDKPVKLMSLRERKLFHLFDDLLTNKYMTCIQKGVEKKEQDSEAIKQLEDVILHTYDQSEFNKRSHAEKDAFATANKLLGCKFFMLLITYLEEQRRIQEIEKEGNHE